METKNICKWIVNNWNKIPDSYKENIKSNYNNIKELCDEDQCDDGLFDEELSNEEHIVVLLLDRQKPSIEPNYDFDEERIGINKNGKIIWGFDSGCSCPTPWDDSYPECYNVSRTWKEFEVNINSFDIGAIEECMNKLNEIKKQIK